MQFKWTKNAGDTFGATAGPFALKIEPTGDGRFNWTIHSGGTRDPMARGVATSLGAAKRVAEQFVMRSGKV